MKKWPWFALALLTLLIDQLTKYTAAAYLVPYQPEAILPMLNFTLAYNTGAAFSFLDNGSLWHRWILATFSLIMSGLLSWWIFKMKPEAKLQLCALSLILGGAVGNLIDRAFYGYVIDFIDVFYKIHHWPDFNFADSAICVGAFLLFIEMWQQDRKPSNPYHPASKS